MTKKILALATLILLFVSLVLSIKNEKLKDQHIDEQKKELPDSTNSQKKDVLNLREEQSIKQSEEELEGNSTPLLYLLDGYASETSSPRADLEVVANVLFSMKKELQGVDTRFLATNEDIVRLLTGANKYKLKLIPEDASIFNEENQLVDRWGSAYRFHLQSAKEIEIRSAGPDKEMFTEDDYIRRPDGAFLSADGSLQR